jgi:hypothetical protein
MVLAFREVEALNKTALPWSVAGTTAPGARRGTIDATVTDLKRPVYES